MPETDGPQGRDPNRRPVIAPGGPFCSAQEGVNEMPLYVVMEPDPSAHIRLVTKFIQVEGPEMNDEMVNDRLRNKLVGLNESENEKPETEFPKFCTENRHYPAKET